MSGRDWQAEANRYRAGISLLIAKLWQLKGGNELQNLADAIAFDLQEILEGKTTEEVWEEAQRYTRAHGESIDHVCREVAWKNRWALYERTQTGTQNPPTEGDD